jgi:BirA family transcriptional regulator, biotin operon repressor / biotin---[acetyl-CoA-carboxylase] ligase
MKQWQSDYGQQIRWYASVGSTNDVAKAWADDGAPDGAVVSADEQTSGRGRRGNAWICPPGQALAFSQILRPTMPRALWSRLALIAGLAVAKALEGCGLQAEVKWPNDVYVSGKKVAGILVEAGNEPVIVGVGINVNVSCFPDELAERATSLYLEQGREWDRIDLLEKIAHRMMLLCRRAEAEFPELLTQIRERCALTGKRVSLRIGEEFHVAEVLGIGDRGELLIQRNDQPESLLQADEIRVIS